MKDVAEAICVVAVLAFLAFTMPTCAGCGEWGPSPANTSTALTARATEPTVVSGPTWGPLWEEEPPGPACEDASAIANETVSILLEQRAQLLEQLARARGGR